MYKYILVIRFYTSRSFLANKTSNNKMSAKTISLNTGAKMPMLGIGTWAANDEKELEIALNTALENGYRHIDTAHAYSNEKIIGNVLKKWFDSGKVKRNELFITTKLPMAAIRPDKVESLLKESLDNLQLAYVDLYLIHFPVGIEAGTKTMRESLANKETVKLGGRTDFAGIWKKMEEAVKAGRTRSIGVSNFNVQQIETILKVAEVKPANLQIENHVYLQQTELVEFCQKNGITVVAYSPLASPGYNKFLTTIGQKTKPLPNILGDETIAKIAKKHNKSQAQIALRFLIERNITPIPKSVTIKRVQENINVFDFALDANDMALLKKLDVGEKARVCDFKMIPELPSHPDFPFNKN